MFVLEILNNAKLVEKIAINIVIDEITINKITTRLLFFVFIFLD